MATSLFDFQNEHDEVKYTFENRRKIVKIIGNSNPLNKDIIKNSIITIFPNFKIEATL